jgi:hypothetical protein
MARIRCRDRWAVVVVKQWGFLTLTVHRESALLGFCECTTNLDSRGASPFIARCDRDPLLTEKGGAPDQGVSWITIETQTRFCIGPVEI